MAVYIKVFCCPRQSYPHTTQIFSEENLTTQSAIFQFSIHSLLKEPKSFLSQLDERMIVKTRGLEDKIYRHKDSRQLLQFKQSACIG